MDKNNTLSLIGVSRHRITVDGTGVTTLVAFHGCPLKCKYCLNPQSISQNGVRKCLTVEELFELVKKDDLYFRATGGGITFGGGEPLLSYKQIQLFKELCVKASKDWNINVETSLNVPKRNVADIADFVNHWIVDIKDMNPLIYKEYTSKDNELVVQNLKFLLETDATITVRVPYIPEFNTKSDIEHSITLLRNMGVTDINNFNYTIPKN